MIISSHLRRIININRKDLRLFSVLPPLIPPPVAPIVPPNENKPIKKTDSSEIDKRIYPIIAHSLLTGTAVGIILPVMPLFAIKLGLSASEYGAVMSMMGVSRLIANIPSAWFAERYGRRPALLGGNVLMTLGIGLTGMSTSVFQLVSARFFTGAGSGLAMTASGLYLTDISNAKNRARTIAPGATAFIAGMGVGPGVGGYLADNVGITMAFYGVSGVIACAAVSNYFLLPETKIFKEEDLKRSISMDGKSVSQKVKHEFSNTMKIWKTIMLDKNLRLITVCHTSYWATASAMSFTMLPMIATQTFGMSGSMLGSCFTAGALIQFIGSQPAAYLSDKYGRKFSLIPSALIVGSSCIAMPLVTNVESFIAVYLFASLGSTFWSSSSQAYVADLAADEKRSQALALLRSCGDIGLVLGSGLVGALASVTSTPISMGVFGSLLIVSISNFALKAKESVTFEK